MHGEKGKKRKAIKEKERNGREKQNRPSREGGNGKRKEE